MFCAGCGNQLPNDASFCTQCGLATSASASKTPLASGGARPAAAPATAPTTAPAGAPAAAPATAPAAAAPAITPPAAVSPPVPAGVTAPAPTPGWNQPAAGAVQQSARPEGSKTTLLVMGAILLVAVLASVVLRQNASIPQPELPTSADSDYTSTPSGDYGDEAAAQTVSTLSDQESYEALNDSWSTLSQLNEEYGPPRSEDTVPAYGWLRDEFGPRITGGDSARRSMADEAATYASRFSTARDELQALEVSPAYEDDKQQLLAVYEISVRRSDAYRQIAEDAIDHDIGHWRALQTSLGTKEMRSELLNAINSYSPPMAP